MIHANLTLIGARRVDLLAATRVRLRVWPNDLDFNLHVNNGRYLTLAGIARMHWFISTGVLQTARRASAIPIVGDALAKFRRDLRVFQRFDPKWITEWNDGCESLSQLLRSEEHGLR